MPSDNAKRTPIVVIGAGVVGMMSAYALAQRGQKVCVIDRLPGPAQLCSHANAGIIAVGHAHAWAGPEAIPSILRALLGREPSIKISRLIEPRLWRWGIEFLSHCTTSAQQRNSTKLQKLSRLSSQLLERREAEMNLPKEIRHQGGLYLYQSVSAFNARTKALSNHPEQGLNVVDSAGIIQRDPGIEPIMTRFAGGLYSESDAVGDCHRFCERTCKYLAESGQVEFLFDTGVEGFNTDAKKITSVRTTQGELACDQVILATGVETVKLTAALGFKPQIYPVKGYSGTWQVRDSSVLPTIPFIDEAELMAVANFGDRLRVTAIAEFAGNDTSLPAERTDLLDSYVRRTFGTAVDLDNPQYWTGMRPSTPVGVPYLGRIRHLQNLWINAGHGQLGWTMSPACAQLLAQKISGASPDVSDVSAQAKWLEPI